MAPSTATSDAPAGEGAEGGGHSDGDAHRSGSSGRGGPGRTAIVLNRPRRAPTHSRPVRAGAGCRRRAAPVEWRRAAAHLPDLPARRLRRCRPRRGEGAPRPRRVACASRRATRRPPSAPIVEQLRATLVDGCGLVDEVLVIDDHSTDATARIAATAGARVRRRRRRAARSSGPARARARRSTSPSPPREGDLIAWCDADILDFGRPLRRRARRARCSPAPTSRS